MACGAGLCHVLAGSGSDGLCSCEDVRTCLGPRVVADGDSSVPAGAAFSVTWQVDVPADVRPGEFRVVGYSTYAAPKTDGVVRVEDLARTELQNG